MTCILSTQQTGRITGADATDGQCMHTHDDFLGKECKF